MRELIRKVKQKFNKRRNEMWCCKLGLPKSTYIVKPKDVSSIKCGEYCAIYAVNSSIKNVEFGDYSFIGSNADISGLKVGKFTCIGPYLKMAIGEHPTRKIVSVHPAFYSVNKGHYCTFVRKQKFDEYKYVDGKFNFVIGNDVWIGSDVLLLEGHTIGDGAIIGAGSVVTKDIPPYEIWAGAPARFIRKRFEDEQIEKLLKIKWWNWPIEKIKKKADSFEDIDSFLALEEDEQKKD